MAGIVHTYMPILKLELYLVLILITVYNKNNAADTFFVMKRLFISIKCFGTQLYL